MASVQRVACSEEELEVAAGQFEAGEEGVAWLEGKGQPFLPSRIGEAPLALLLPEIAGKLMVEEAGTVGRGVSVRVGQRMRAAKVTGRGEKALVAEEVAEEVFEEMAVGSAAGVNSSDYADKIIISAISAT